MKLLAIETATEACSAAVYVDGQVYSREAIAPQKHSELILPMCDEVLADAGLSRVALDAVAFGRGPGSFTGLRIAVGVAQGAAFALDRPVVPVSTLAALAQGAADEGADHILAALDARMGEVYWGAFQVSDGLVTAAGPERVSAPEAVSPPGAGPWTGVGSGWASYGSLLQAPMGTLLQRVLDGRFPLARHVALLAAQAYAAGESVAAHEALPVYLRDNVADPRARIRP